MTVRACTCVCVCVYVCVCVCVRVRACVRAHIYDFSSLLPSHLAPSAPHTCQRSHVTGRQQRQQTPHGKVLPAGPAQRMWEVGDRRETGPPPGADLSWTPANTSTGPLNQGPFCSTKEATVQQTLIPRSRTTTQTVRPQRTN